MRIACIQTSANNVDFQTTARTPAYEQNYWRHWNPSTWRITHLRFRIIWCQQPAPTDACTKRSVQLARSRAHRASAGTSALGNTPRRAADRPGAARRAQSSLSSGRRRSSDRRERVVRPCGLVTIDADCESGGKTAPRCGRWPEGGWFASERGGDSAGQRSLARRWAEPVVVAEMAVVAGRQQQVLL